MAVKDQKALTLPHLSGVDPDGTPSSRDTCGWISGRPESALTCHPGQRCAVDSARSLVGCCWTPLDGACRLSTRCLEGGPRSDARDGGDAARTLDLVCRGEAAPYCKTDVFASDSIIDGFSLLICGTDRRTETAFRFTVDSSTASSPSSRIQTATSLSSLTASTPIPNPVGPSHLSTSLGSAFVTPAPSTAPYPPLPSSSASAASPWAVTGAILGSVGGLAAVAGAAWLLWKLVIRPKISLRGKSEKERRATERPAQRAEASGEAATQTEYQS
ncbi:hypothetical protein GQ602_004753 [Ophiocordyceps camponoti-floridani]|uniref:Mid2 domain-containing protein n=1 Tax=Ophiocordyceps camponoti-floridani TaxID=2030778 RepID=A0A8H4Q4D7_9HYPO|nr:hypothetical protein GQ602_004753 [Ophiocordyceps camponoti-floridani]